MKWLDVNTIRFERGSWTIDPSQLADIPSFEALPIQLSRSARFLKEMTVRASREVALARMTGNSKHKAGSRTAGALIDELLKNFAIDDLPGQVFLSTTNGSEGVIQARLAIPLALMSSPQRRLEFFRKHRRCVIPSPAGLKPKAYEDFVRSSLRNEAYRGWKLLDRERLFSSKPDAIAINDATGQVDIIEIKQLAPDLLEGASQIMLYREQASVLETYAGYDISTVLVTAKREPEPSYRMWEHFMLSQQSIQFHVTDAGLESTVRRSSIED